MAIKLGTKVVMNNAEGYGILPNDIGLYSTIVGYVESSDEKYFKNGAYYLNPPIGNNKQREIRKEGWGISNKSFAVSGGKEKLILAGAYFINSLNDE